MVGIVEGIEEVFVERVYILKAWEAVENGLEFFGERLGGELDFSSIKACKNRLVANEKSA